MPVNGLPEGTLYSIINASPVGMLLLDQQSRILFANKKAEQIFGYTSKAFQQMSVHQLLSERLRARHADYVTAFLRQPQSRAMGLGRELVGMHRDGHNVSLEVGFVGGDEVGETGACLQFLLQVEHGPQEIGEALVLHEVGVLKKPEHEVALTQKMGLERVQFPGLGGH